MSFGASAEFARITAGTSGSVDSVAAESPVQPAAAGVELRLHQRARLDPARRAETTGRGAITGTPACADASSRVTYCAYSGGRPSAAIEARCEASSFSSRASCSTPQGSQRTSDNFFQRERAAGKTCTRQLREDAVVRRDDRVECSGVVARGLPRRLGVALVERRPPSRALQRRSHTAAPARPAPTTTACLFARIGSTSRVRTLRATSISRLWPKPARFSHRKPCCLQAQERTAEATLQVAAVAPGAARRESERMSCGDHMSGFFAGAKPSR